MGKLKKMKQVLSDITEAYCELVRSGDAGNWDPETDKEVREARRILTKKEEPRE